TGASPASAIEKDPPRSTTLPPPAAPGLTHAMKVNGRPPMLRLLEAAMRSTSLPLNVADWPAKPAEVGTVETLLLLRVRSLTGEPEKSSARISDASNTPAGLAVDATSPP